MHSAYRSEHLTGKIHKAIMKSDQFPGDPYRVKDVGAKKQPATGRPLHGSNHFDRAWPFAPDEETCPKSIYLYF